MHTLASYSTIKVYTDRQTHKTTVTCGSPRSSTTYPIPRPGLKAELHYSECFCLCVLSNFQEPGYVRLWARTQIHTLPARHYICMLEDTASIQPHFKMSPPCARDIQDWSYITHVNQTTAKCGKNITEFNCKRTKQLYAECCTLIRITNTLLTQSAKWKGSSYYVLM